MALLGFVRIAIWLLTVSPLIGFVVIGLMLTVVGWVLTRLGTPS